MAAIPDAFIDEVLARVDLLEVIGAHVALKKSGRSYMGLCPFHAEKTPSFSVSPDKGLYYCFGCGRGGNAITFLMEYEGLSFPEAVKELAARVGLPVPEARPSAEEQRLAQGYALLAELAEAMHKQLFAPEGAKARAYLRRRGLDEALIRKWGLGYAPRHGAWLARAFGRHEALLRRMGLVRDGQRGAYAFFRDRVMFPIRDRRGRVVGFGGRVIGEGEPKYLNSPDSEWFHKHELLFGFYEQRDWIRELRQVLVVEGYFDVLALAQHRALPAVAPLGTALGDAQLRLLLRQGKCVFCFDGDTAGRRAAWRALERLLPHLEAEHEVRFLFLPEGEDPDSMVRRVGSERFRAFCERQAMPASTFWLAGLKRLAGEGAEGRARMAKTADRMLRAIRDPYLREAWRKEAEQAVGLPLGAAAPISRPQQEAAPDPLPRRFFLACVQKPERMADLPEVAVSWLDRYNEVSQAYRRLWQLVRSGQTPKVASVVDAMPRLARWLVEEPDITDDEFGKLAARMHALWLRQEIEAAASRGALAEVVRLRRDLEKLEHMDAR